MVNLSHCVIVMSFSMHVVSVSMIFGSGHVCGFKCIESVKRASDLQQQRTNPAECILMRVAFAVLISLAK
jgi:hypothetical protein